MSSTVKATRWDIFDSARVVDSDDCILATWTLLTNVAQQDADASKIALWYYWRWRIESFFKLLKSHGEVPGNFRTVPPDNSGRCLGLRTGWGEVSERTVSTA
ncbi:hypothetical protein I41_32940 [Lacipirellula limnantheis]|uniref:Transposase IS4-like domain-containing protein n=1 Tax=Lacipirellula limnantheis TaxID=2528024 RepID=A0A517U0E3_9BACT|nr:hypothetical protein I41_32940 [Lacipirellula limnantheis]